MQANAASVALIRDGDVLLIQRAFEPFAGLWTLPGGRREPGESIELTARREIMEELGIAVIDLRPVLVMEIGHGFRLAVFASNRFSGEILASNEISDWRWLSPASLASLPTTPELDHVLAATFAPESGDRPISGLR